MKRIEAGLLILLVSVGTLSAFGGRIPAEIRSGAAAICLAGALGGLWFFGATGRAIASLVVGLSLALIVAPVGVLAHDMAGLAVSAGVIWLLTAGVVRLLLPKLDRREQRAAAVLPAALALGHLFVAFALWRTADDYLQLPQVPVAKTGSEVLALFDAGYAARLHGVLAPGLLGEAVSQSAANSRPEIARYDCGSFRNKESAWLPNTYALTLAGGPTVLAQGVASTARTWAWPYVGHSRCALRAGDPVVFWAEPGAAWRMGDSARLASLNATRLIAYGTPDDFRATYLPAAVTAARLFAALAAILVGTSLIPIIAAIRTWRRLGRASGANP